MTCSASDSIDVCTMKPAGLIVWERTGDWAFRLRRAFGAHAPAVREVRTVDEFLSRLAQSPASIAAIELRVQQANQILEQLWHIERYFPRARSVVLAQSTLVDYAPAVFEAGARALVTTPGQLASLARFIQRHLATAHSACPPANASRAGDVTPPESEWIRSVLDELFDDLAESDGEVSIHRSVERLGALLPRNSNRRS